MPTSTAREGWRLHEPTSSGEIAADAQDLRRRRREAVVIHDGDADRPFTEEDVFMRGPEYDADNIGRAAMIALVAPGDSASVVEAMEQIGQLNARLGEHA
jgi:phosphomannomutase